MRSMKLAASALLAPLALSAALISGCQEEGYVTLFDENGAWSLVMYNLEGSYLPIDSNNRRDKFLLLFKRTSAAEARPAGKLAAATCIDAMGDQGLKSSSCDAGFTCRCFDYTYEDATMVATEYAAEGATLYEPAEDEPAPGEPVTIFLTAAEDAGNTYNFKPLPFKLFESDGVNSQYQFQQKAASIFDQTGCGVACFGAEE